ncbi:MAG: hypothetical protein GC157_07175 [Frankiales bacterium]|nr:hypothetical protein [Frankiales bacterium]
MGLITEPELQTHIRQVTTWSPTIQASAAAAIEDASGLVLEYCEWLETPWTDATAPASAKLVVKRLAARLFDNPQQRVSYTGPEGLNYSGGPVRLLTDDEKATLDRLDPRRVAVGTIGLALPAWTVPDTTS